MPQAKATKFVKSFVKGLITEAAYLTYPEDASNDELNTNLHVRGNRTRRLGLDFEPDSTPTTFTGLSDTDITSEFFWRSVANKAEINFLVLQVGNYIYFYDASVSPLSAGRKSFGINMNSFKAPSSTLTQVHETRCDFAVGKGYLFISNGYCDPVTVEYHPETDTITTVRVIIQTRDFDGVRDGLANDAEPTFLTAHHQYNLRNQGWVRSGSNSVQSNYPVEEDVSIPVGGSGGDGSGSTGGGSTGGGGTGSGGGGFGGYGGFYDPYTGSFHDDGFFGPTGDGEELE